MGHHARPPLASDRRFFLVLGGIIVVAFAVRIAFLGAYSPDVLPLADGYWYHNSANLLADGHGLIDPLTYVFRAHVRQSAGHPPLFVFVLGAVSFLGGTSTLTHQIVELALDVAAVGVIGLLAREIGGNRIGAIAAFMAALYPRFWATEGEVLSESLYALTVATMLLLTYRFIQVPSWRRAAWLGVFVGLMALTRGEGLLFLPLMVVPVALLHARAAVARRVVVVTAAIAGTLLIVAPWTAYNATRFRDPVLVTTGVGTVIAGANCDMSYYGKWIGFWDINCGSPKGVTGDESVRSSKLQHMGTDYARDHLTRMPVVMGVRVARLLEIYEPDPATFGSRWVKRLLLASWYTTVPLAVAGAIVLRRRGISLAPFGLTIVAVVLNAALTWGTPRFRIPIDIVVVVLAAVAVDTVLRSVAGRRRNSSGHQNDLALGDHVVTNAVRPQHG